MKSLIMVVALATASSPLVAAEGPMAPVNAFLAAFNKGDAAGMAAAGTGDVANMDEVPLHLWRGPGAVKAWLTSLAAYDKAHDRSGGAVALGRPQVQTVAEDRAYAVVPAVYTFSEAGKPMREAATMTYALRHRRRLEDHGLELERHRSCRSQIASATMPHAA